MTTQFAEVINGVVTREIVAEQFFIDSGAVGDPANWKCSRHADGTLPCINGGGIGYEWHEDIKAFVPPKPFDSFVLDKAKAQYVAPVAMPKDGKNYTWDEKSVAWKAVSAL